MPDEDKTFSGSSVLTSRAHALYVANNSSLSSLPPLVVGRTTLFAAGHVTTCDTNFSTGVESTNTFCQLKRGKGHR